MVRKQAFLFVPARYIRTFDVISEVNRVLLLRKRRFERISYQRGGKFLIKRQLLAN